MFKYSNSSCFYNRTHLYNCDSLNKYCVSNVYGIPRLKKIVLHYTFKDFQGFENPNLDLTELRAYMFFFLFFFLSPHVRFKLSDLNTNLSRTESGNFIFKISFENARTIDDFVRSFFFNNLEKLKHEFFSTRSSKKQLFDKSLRTFNFNLKLSSSFFCFDDSFSTTSIESLRFRDFLIKVNFIGEGFFAPLKKPFLLSNIPPFWING